MPRPFKLRVIVGDPIHLEPIEVNPKNQDRLQDQAEHIMDKVYELSGEDYNNNSS
jgi:hypothetical protein